MEWQALSRFDPNAPRGFIVIKNSSMILVPPVDMRPPPYGEARFESEGIRRLARLRASWLSVGCCYLRHIACGGMPNTYLT